MKFASVATKPEKKTRTNVLFLLLKTFLKFWSIAPFLYLVNLPEKHNNNGVSPADSLSARASSSTQPAEPCQQI